MPFQKGNKIGARFKPGQSGNPGGRSGAQKLFEENFYRALYDDRLRRRAMAALKKAIIAGEAWALRFYFERALPSEPIHLHVAPDIAKLRSVILEALETHPEARIAVARRLLEVGQAIDTPFEQVQ